MLLLRCVVLLTTAVLLVSSRPDRVVSAKPRPTLLGTLSPNTLVFQGMNQWINENTSVVAQSIRVVEVGWSHLDTIPSGIALLYDTWQNCSAVPVLTWMPFGYLNWSSPTPNQDVCDGLYDEYLDTFYTQLRAFLAGSDGVLGTSDDRRVYLRFAPAANGDWFPWSPACPACGNTGQAIHQTPLSYVRMFQYVVDKARFGFNLNESVMQVVWGVNSVDAAGMGWRMEEFYPGASYMDWAAISGVNFGTALPGNSWTTAPALVADAQQRLAVVLPSDLPMALLTLASTSVPNGTEAKNQWLRGVFDVVVASFQTHTPDVNRVRMVAYHNFDVSPSQDFGVFAGMHGSNTWTPPPKSPLRTVVRTYDALRDSARENTWVQRSQPWNPRLIPDDVFWGQ